MSRKQRSDIGERIDIGHELLYLTRDDCMNTELTRQDILDLTRDALIAHGRDEYEMPAKIGVHPYEDVFYHAMPAYVPAHDAVGAKWIECYPRNPSEHNLPQTTGLLILNDVETGVPLAVMDSTWLTAMRTPAVTVLAAEKLHPDARIFGMFGCGVQGTEHVRFITKTLPKLERIYIYDIDDAAADRLIANVKNDISTEIVRGEDPHHLAEECEILCSATIITPETLSVVKDDWVSPGQTILPCDLNTFWDPAITWRADKYIVDSREEHELFRDEGYFPDGLPPVYCETGEIIADLVPGRSSPDELIVCSNIGMAVCDVVLARAIFDRALDAGVGRILPL